MFDDVTNELFDLVTGEYLKTKDRVLRQVAIEGVCKMMFVPKLCDENDPAKVEGIIAQLLIQLFDKKYNWQNSFSRSILTLFLKEFVLFSEKRCMLVLNAMTKVIYSIFKKKYGMNPAKKVEQAKQKPAAKNAKAKKGKRKYDSDYDSEEESDFSIEQESVRSDDSEFVHLATMQQICESLDSA